MTDEQRTAQLEAISAIYRAVMELDSARKSMLTGLNVPAASEAGIALDDAISAVHHARRKIGLIR